ncbi:hypothetical protein ACFVH4_28470 [Nocardia ignorata]|uniref:Uncharacterized protein n=1 Tax=Nocardia coubleae TaxID=356147 RepID=A0A846WCB5_9NOCA|nr:hypothetical protein [Nocardia coubleae]NKX90423.1 hypothetical protein [Nocardia coubleae]
MTAAERVGVVECHRCRLFVEVLDRDRCGTRLAQLLARARQHWTSHSDRAVFGPRNHWDGITLDDAVRCPGDLVEAAAAGCGCGDQAEDLATVLMLLSGCPVVVEPVAGQPCFLLSLYGLADDDLGLAETLVQVFELDHSLRVVDRTSWTVPVAAR